MEINDSIHKGVDVYFALRPSHFMPYVQIYGRSVTTHELSWGQRHVIGTTRIFVSIKHISINTVYCYIDIFIFWGHLLYKTLILVHY